jgi:hypothetical protein
MMIEGQAVCDPQSGAWVFKLTTNDPFSIGLDTLQAYSQTPGVSVANGPNISVVPPPGLLNLTGAAPGQLVDIEVCGFNGAAAASGKPYDCCRATLRMRVPEQVCRRAGAPTP